MSASRNNRGFPGPPRLPRPPAAHHAPPLSQHRSLWMFATRPRAFQSYVSERCVDVPAVITHQDRHGRPVLPVFT